MLIKHLIAGATTFSMTTPNGLSDSEPLSLFLERARIKILVDILRLEESLNGM